MRSAPQLTSGSIHCRNYVEYMYIVSYGSTSSTTLSIFPPDAVSPLLLLCQGQNRELPISRVPKCAYIHGTLAQASHASFLAPVLRWNLHPGFMKPSH
jgi:hypothetical protein